MTFYQHKPNESHLDFGSNNTIDCKAVIIIYDYIVDLQLKKASKIIGKNETIWTTNSAYLCILEIILLIPHPNIITMCNLK